MIACSWRRLHFSLSFLALIAGCTKAYARAHQNVIRVATYNLMDIRSEDLANGGQARLKKAASVIQRVSPDILLINEIQFDFSAEGKPIGENGQLFADRYLAVPQNGEVPGILYESFAPTSNTGVISGWDLDQNGKICSIEDQGERPYGSDSWGYGEFPGKYAMAVLVRKDLVVDTESIRTFQNFKWKDMPHAMIPMNPESGEPWYHEAIWNRFPLSSKNHIDLPVVVGNRVLHVLASHPTPPVFDGAEDRNGARNHDEIRFWADYISNADFIYDDRGNRGGLGSDAKFVILGDLNADPDDGDSTGNPIKRWFFDHAAINGTFVPKFSPESDSDFGPANDDSDTTSWGLRVDYVLPSQNLRVLKGAVEGISGVSDHAMVWIDIELQ